MNILANLNVVGDLTISGDSTAYVPNLNIGIIGSGTPISNLGFDATGNVVTGTTNIIGTGTTNYISKWTSASAIGNSLLFDDGTNVGIGTATPTSSRLHIKGSTTDAIAYGLKVDNSASAPLLHVYNSGQIKVGDASGNIFFGTSSGLNLTIGTNNVSLGYGALAAITSGTDTIAIGKNALLSVTTAIQNNAFGSGALQSVTTGYENCAFGYAALSSGIEAYFNCAFGNYALASTTSGGENCAFGRASLYSNTTGNYNVGVGTNAGRNNSTGTLNVFLGQSSGYNATGSSNIFLGYAAGYNLGAVSNTLIIDNQDRGVGNDLTNSLIYGVFNATVANQLLRFNANVGIGTAPVSTSKLSIVGTTNDATAYGLKVDNSTPTTLFSVRNDGQVSSLYSYSLDGNRILHYGKTPTNAGTTTSIYIGHQAGNSATSTEISNVAVGAGALLSVAPGSNDWRNVAIGNSALGTLHDASGGGAVSNVAVGYQAGVFMTTGYQNTLLGSSAGSSMTTGTNNIIIGFGSDGITTGQQNIMLGISCTNTLSSAVNSLAVGTNVQLTASNQVVFGNGYFDWYFGQGISFAGQTTPIHFNIASVTTGTTNALADNWFFDGGKGTGTGKGSDFIFRTAPAGASGSTQNSLVERLRINSDGNVGIGTSTFGTSGVKVLGIANGTAPSTGTTDMFQLYSDDVVAGKASAHFINETGDVIKMYKETALTTVDATALSTGGAAVLSTSDQTVIDNMRTRINELESKLQAIGYLQ